jgi:hypothetical protein
MLLIERNDELIGRIQEWTQVDLVNGNRLAAAILASTRTQKPSHEISSAIFARAEPHEKRIDKTSDSITDHAGLFMLLLLIDYDNDPILFNDAGFALIDFAALLRFRCASQNLGSTGGFSCLRLSLMFPTTYDHL